MLSSKNPALSSFFPLHPPITNTNNKNQGLDHGPPGKGHNAIIKTEYALHLQEGFRQILGAQQNLHYRLTASYFLVYFYWTLYYNLKKNCYLPEIQISLCIWCFHFAEFGNATHM